MLDVTAGGWTATLALIAGLLAVDWFLLGRRPHPVRFGEALRWSVFYVLAALLFGGVFALVNGWTLGAQYFAGYVVEKSLSVDNLFVFVMIIGSFAVPTAQQPKVLTIGIVIALMLRGIFIAAGAALLELFSFMLLIFGLILVGTSIQLFRNRDLDPNVDDNLVVGLARKVLPISSSYDGSRVITRQSGRKQLTPLFLALLAIGTTDLLFAFDSIPAVFGVTEYPYIVFAANAFALLGLRPLFFLVSGLLRRLVYLPLGLALILGFIGIKLTLQFAHHLDHAIPEVSTVLSLGVILAVLATVAAASALTSRREPSTRAHAGSLRRSSQTSKGISGPVGGAEWATDTIPSPEPVQRETRQPVPRPGRSDARGHSPG